MSHCTTSAFSEGNTPQVGFLCCCLYSKHSVDRSHFDLLAPVPTEKVRGKRVLVTGSSTGIGEQIAYEFARMGANIVVTARREHVLEKVSCESSE